jgi:hypothetical protein
VVEGERHKSGMTPDDVLLCWQEAFDNVPGKYVSLDVIKGYFDRGFAWDAYYRSKIDIDEFENDFYPNWLKENSDGEV